MAMVNLETYIKVRERGKTMQEIQERKCLSEATAYCWEIGYQCYLKKMPLDKALEVIDSKKTNDKLITIEMGKLEDWPITHLRNACRKNKVKGYTKMSKEELVQEVRKTLKKFGEETK